MRYACRYLFTVFIGKLFKNATWNYTVHKGSLGECYSFRLLD